MCFCCGSKVDDDKEEIEMLKQQLGEKDKEIEDLKKKMYQMREAQRKKEMDEKDKIIADMRDMLRGKQQGGSLDPPSYEKAASRIPALTEREKFVLRVRKMEGHYFGNDAVKGVRPPHDKEDYMALMKSVAKGLRTFNVKCTLKSDVEISMFGWKIRQVSKIPGLTLLIGEMVIIWELFLSKDGEPVRFKAKCDYIGEPSGRSIKTQDWETSENDDGEAKVGFVTDGNGKDVRWNVTILD